MPLASPIKVALRFDRRDAPNLWLLAHTLGNGTDDRGAFARAAESAERDEPLIVHCQTRDEITRIADRFASHGFHRPAIDELH